MSQNVSPYGPLVSDPKGILDLPQGFRYKILSRSGQEMSDGLIVPEMPDGMASFQGEAKDILLVRNHELSVEESEKGAFRRSAPSTEHEDLIYDARNKYAGGTTTLVLDGETLEVKQEFLSLAGTDRNCAGGKMPWGSWITCEESIETTTPRGKSHGYCFEVKATADGKLQKAVPLKALGRFCHEAVAIDPRSGILYLTEDRQDGLVYRFSPDLPGDLSSGKLEALAIVGHPSLDTRNYDTSEISAGKAFSARWIPLEEVESPKDDLRLRGFEAGAARFARGEGIEFHEGDLYICCTDGGPERFGQLFKLTPGDNSSEDKLELFIQPSASDLLTNGDNLCAAPWGDLVICEDLIKEHAQRTPHLRGINPQGEIYTIARNAFNKSEFAGSCFSPDGRTLFVNMQSPGYTIAIQGPWKAS